MTTATGAFINYSGNSQTLWASPGNIPSVMFKLNPVVNAAATTPFIVQANQAGTTFVLPANGATITLPAPENARGCYFKFVMGANGATAGWGLQANPTSSSKIYGVVVQGANTTPTKLNFVGATSVVISTTALRGDWVSIESNGVDWNIQGTGGAAASFA